MTYQLEKSSIKDFDFIIHAISYENPLEHVHEISQDIAKHTGEPCEILFDLLLSNGYEFNRFVSCHFDGKRIDEKSLTIRSITDSKTLESIDSWYSDKPDYLANSVLNTKQQDRLLFC